MSVLEIVVPLAVLVVAAAVGAFAWAVRRGQFDDLTTPAVRALFDDPEEQRRAAPTSAPAPAPPQDETRP